MNFKESCRSTNRNKGISIAYWNGRDQAVGCFYLREASKFLVGVKVKKYGELKIIKYNEDKTAKVKNTTYRITGANNYDKTFTTDKNGEIYVKEMPVGEYIVYETQASDGYLINVTQQSFRVNGNQLSTIEFNNTEPTRKITLTKSIDTTQ